MTCAQCSVSGQTLGQTPPSRFAHMCPSKGLASVSKKLLEERNLGQWSCLVVGIWILTCLKLSSGIKNGRLSSQTFAKGYSGAPGSLRTRPPDSITQRPYQGTHELISVGADSQSCPSACFHYFRGFWSCEVDVPDKLFIIPSASSCFGASWPDLWRFCDLDLGPY